MGRLIGAVLLGYVVVALCVFAGLSAAYVELGPDGAFRPGVYDVSALWLVISLIVGFVAAVLGGWVARRIARSPTGPRVLAGLIAALGVALALVALVGEPAATGVRTEAIGTTEAMQYARTPVWMMFLNALIGALGVLVGGKALRRGTDPAPGIAVPTPNVH
jgi:hypothetical protein